MIHRPAPSSATRWRMRSRCQQCTRVPVMLIWSRRSASRTAAAGAEALAGPVPAAEGVVGAGCVPVQAECDGFGTGSGHLGNALAPQQGAQGRRDECGAGPRPRPPGWSRLLSLAVAACDPSLAPQGQFSSPSAARQILLPRLPGRRRLDGRPLGTVQASAGEFWEPEPWAPSVNPGQGDVARCGRGIREPGRMRPVVFRGM